MGGVVKRLPKDQDDNTSDNKDDAEQDLLRPGRLLDSPVDPRDDRSERARDADRFRLVCDSCQRARRRHQGLRRHDVRR